MYVYCPSEVMVADLTRIGGEQLRRLCGLEQVSKKPVLSRSVEILATRLY